MRSDPRPSYRRKKSNWVTPKTMGAFFVIFSLGLLFYFTSDTQPSSGSPLSRVMLTISAILQSGKNLVTGSFGDLADNLRAKRKLTAMEEELDALRQENTKLRFQMRQHESYVEAMELPRDDSYPTVAAIVVAHDERLASSFIVNRGANDGLTVNMPVWNQQGLIGRTEKLSPHAARIMPITDPNSAIGIYVEGTSYEGVLRGSDDYETLLITDLYLLSGDEENILPQPGQAVYTSGRGMVFPRNILAGYISDATAEGGEYTVKPAAEIRSVHAVLVMRQTPQQQEILSLLSEE